MLNVGEVIDDFSLPDADNQTRSLSEFLARGRVILYFYPADFTPVCTAEACAFRDNFAGVEEIGVQIVGVSPQSAGSHRRFTDRYDLPFPLLSDERKSVIKQCKAEGPFGFGVRRVTYLLDTDGTILNRATGEFSTSAHVDLLREVVANYNSSS